MKPSAACINLIKHFEGCKLVAYPDVRGKATIGYGHTGKDLKLGDTITQDQAEALLLRDVEFIGKCVYSMTGKIPQCQFDAILSLAYNVGPEEVRGSHLLHKLEQHDIEGAAKEFADWNHAGGHVIEGLTKRRMAETAVFLGLA